MTRLLSLTIILMAVAGYVRASADGIGDLHVNLEWRNEANFGDIQSYILSLRPSKPLDGVYALWALDDNINPLSVESDMPCSFTAERVVLCYQPHMTTAYTITVTGVLVGEPTGSGYTTAIVGDAIAERHRMMPVTQYRGTAGTIPWPIPTHPPLSVILFPDIRFK